MLSTVVSLILAASVSSGVAPFLTFSKAPAFGPSRTTVEIGQLVGPVPVRERNYWLRRTVQTGEKLIIDWTDTKRCPAATAAIRQAATISPPQIWVPGVEVLPDGRVIVTGDGTAYEITVGAHYDGNVSSDIHFTSSDGSPLADWIEESLSILEPCWSKVPPVDELL